MNGIFDIDNFSAEFLQNIDDLRAENLSATDKLKVSKLNIAIGATNISSLLKIKREERC